MDLFLDTSFIIPLIIETDTTRRAWDFFSSFSGTCAVSMNTRVREYPEIPLWHLAIKPGH
jgi:hypothetical protein